MYLIIGLMFKLLGEICDKEKEGDPLFLFFVTNLKLQTYREDTNFFYVVTKT